MKGAFDRLRTGQLSSSALLFHQPRSSKRNGHCQSPVIIIDNHPIFLQGLSRCLQQRGIAARSRSVRSAFAGVEMAGYWRSQVLMADFTKLEELDENYFLDLRRTYPGAQVLVVVEKPDADLVERLLQAGALGCIARGKSIDNFIEAIEAIGHQEIYVDKKLALQLVAKWFEYRSGPSVNACRD